MILTKPKSVNAGPSSGTGEGVAHSKRWYVALVRMHHEKKVAERLSKMGIDSFVPVQQQIHQWSDRRKMVDTVLLPMMVFVHVNPKERMEVLSFSTVSRYMVMRGESTPAVIPDEQMARFRFMLDYSEEAVCMNDTPLARGEKVFSKSDAIFANTFTSEIPILTVNPNRFFTSSLISNAASTGDANRPEIPVKSI